MKVDADNDPSVPGEPARPSDARELRTGEVFGSGYRVVRRIKAGGMGAIYEVVHLTTRRRRALKVLLPSLVVDAAERERFTREATVTADVQSEHLVEVFDAGIDTATGMPFLVMELLHGEDLGELLARRGRLDPGEVVDLLGQAARALEKTHAAGIVHRDLKPGNVFVSRRDDGSPWVKLLDFGIAKVALAGAESATNTGALGTPLYMAPEQMRSKRRLGPAADLYAVAHLAFRMLAGVTYWDEERHEAESVMQLLVVISRGPREPATARAARRGVTLPPAFDAWFVRAAAARPQHRYDSAANMIVELAAALDESAPPSLVRDLPRDPPSAPSGGAPGTLPAEEASSASVTASDPLRSPTPPTMPSRSTAPEPGTPITPKTPSYPAEDSTPTRQERAPPAPAGRDGEPPRAPAAGIPGSHRRASRPGWKVAVLTIALAGLVVALLPRRRAPTVEPPRAGTVGATPTVAPPAPQASVEVSLAALPSEARLYLDGALLPTNPFRSKVPREEAMHHLRAEAPGYVTSTTEIALDRDATIMFTLERERSAEPVASRVPVQHGGAGPVQGGASAPKSVVPRPSAGAAGSAAAVPVSTGSPVGVPRTDCSPPFVIDERGIKKFKPECL